MIDEFCDWFEGEYDNWQQASSWPSWFAYILLEHKRTGPYTFHCEQKYKHNMDCLLYTSPSPRDATLSRMPSSA